MKLNEKVKDYLSTLNFMEVWFDKDIAESNIWAVLLHIWPKLIKIMMYPNHNLRTRWASDINSQIDTIMIHRNKKITNFSRNGFYG